MFRQADCFRATAAVTRLLAGYTSPSRRFSLSQLCFVFCSHVPQETTYLSVESRHFLVSAAAGQKPSLFEPNPFLTGPRASCLQWCSFFQMFFIQKQAQHQIVGDSKNSPPRNSKKGRKRNNGTSRQHTFARRSSCNKMDGSTVKVQNPACIH